MKRLSTLASAFILALGLVFVSPAFAGQEGTYEGEVMEEPECSFVRAMNSLKLQTEAHDALWGLGEAAWAVDLETGIIEFTNDKGWTITAPVQVVGTYNTLDKTWLWGWDHPSVSEPVAQHAKLVNGFGKKHALELLTTRKVEISEDQAWEFTALASYLAEAQGAYRGPLGTTLVYMTFGEVKIVKE
ncbi:DUF6882 domain-containing protein [Pontixanthobacter sp. CEM42]|uniref:DUF6882 domain-containing protein n=1 Tax=Pontixanthobacter sp. CEM42 TaxID=2792077 RepID=UPI001AE0062C|nr:DUF6882 domain-containing protein [Pontixanthobacter sp. CEM42]